MSENLKMFRRNSVNLQFSFYIVSLILTLIVSVSADIISNFTAETHLRVIRAASGSYERLIDEPSCEKIKILCRTEQKSGPESSDDLTILECVQTFLTSHIEELNDDCQNAIWKHTVAVLDDKNVVRLVEKSCSKEIENFFDCKTTKQPGRYLACVLDKREMIKNTGCQNILQRLEWVAFSDFRLIGMFVRDCEKDVITHNCGRLNTDKKKLSQGETIACLQTHLSELNNECKKGILKVSELQSDNIKSDRQLFVLCQNDAVRFCPNLHPGNGEMYKCLWRNRNDPIMSKICYDQLLRRDKLISSDYKVSRGLAKACRDDIKNNHCRRGVSEDKDVRLAQILLCLEAAMKNATKLTDECKIEIAEHRKLLMEDYHMTPEIVTGCSDDIEKFCHNIEGHGKTIHCLMEATRFKKKKSGRVTSQCQRALEELIKVSDVGEDWRVDPILYNSCKSVVDVACHDLPGGNANIMSCLMEKLQTNYMTKDCEQSLLQIQYFVARDYKLDPQLYKSCRTDAVRLCKAKDHWADVDGVQADPERGPLILPCLHRYAYGHETGDRLSRECLDQVKRVMRQRAVAVDLIPEVEDECLDDLSNFCGDRTERGEEMTCLQDNLEKLSDNCKAAVISYTEDEVGHIELNPILSSVCHDAMIKYCDEFLKNGRDEGDIMECLISHKNDQEMRQDVKCRATIEHFQIISLKNYHFTYKFKEACRPHVSRFCPSSTTKYDVVACLSERMRNDTIAGNRHTIPKECRQQVRAQLLQQRESINLNPELKESCRDDIRQYCSDFDAAAGQVLECLQSQPVLSESCRHLIFDIRRSELTDGRTDYTLLNTCKMMIKMYCNTVDDGNMLGCLKVNKDKPEFDQRCHLVVVNRMIEQNLDYRFNPTLQAACKENIRDHCTKVIAGSKRNEELNGKVIECLKGKFREAKLTKKCEKQMTEILHEQALNYRLNPLLQSVCKAELETICKPTTEDIEDHGLVEECLKTAFLINNRVMTKECRLEVATMIQESKADIHVDPLLQNACAIDLLKYCSQVQSGNGRLLRCLQTILYDESKALDEDCKTKLVKRMEMYQNAEQAIPENLGELYSQVVMSPAKRYFMLVIITFVGVVFIVGIFCGRVSRRTIVSKNK